MITLAGAMALGGLTSTPSLAGVITPTEKATVSTGSPINSVYYGGCPYRRHHYHWRGCHAAWSPCSGWRYSYAYPVRDRGWGGYGWGGGWGGGGLLGAGLFGIL